MQPGSRENSGNAARAHSRAEQPKSSDEVADECRKPVHRLAHLDERLGALIIEALCPRGDGERGDEELPSGLRLRPASRCA
jgi:hypothetical protein